MKKGFFRLLIIAIIFIPPWLIIKHIVFPIKIDEHYSALSSATSSTPEENFDSLLETQIDELNQVGLAAVVPMVRYNTSLENDSYASLFNSSGTRLSFETATLQCSNHGNQKDLIYGTSMTIANDLDVVETENALRNFNCNGFTYPAQPDGIIFTIPPHDSLLFWSELPIIATPTEKSYWWAYLAVAVLWIGFLVLVKEMLHLIKDGLKGYFWNS